MKETAKKIGLGIVAGYLLLCVSVYFFPEIYFYHPYSYPGNIAKANADGFAAKEIVYHDYGGLNVKGWLYLNKSTESNGKIILFLHGNSYNLEHYYHKTVPFIETGYSVFIPEYRGFGGQGKKIRQKYLEEDAVNAVKYLNSIGFSNKNIVVYGMSLGSYTALYATVNMQHGGEFDALILEVPFTSLLDTAKFHVTFGGILSVPLDLLVWDTYNNVNLISEVKTRILIMTTESDGLIPPAQAKRLYELAAEPKMLKVYQGATHDTLFNLRNYRDILEWLQLL